VNSIECEVPKSYDPTVLLLRICRWWQARQDNPTFPALLRKTAQDNLHLLKHMESLLIAADVIEGFTDEELDDLGISRADFQAAGTFDSQPAVVPSAAEIREFPYQGEYNDLTKSDRDSRERNRSI